MFAKSHSFNDTIKLTEFNNGHFHRRENDKKRAHLFLSMWTIFFTMATILLVHSSHSISLETQNQDTKISVALKRRFGNSLNNSKAATAFEEKKRERERKKDTMTTKKAYRTDLNVKSDMNFVVHWMCVCFLVIPMLKQLVLLFFILIFMSIAKRV